MADYGLICPQPVLGVVAEPYDTLFLRDPRPFGAADLGRSMPVPLPQTVTGMVRRWLGRANGVDLNKLHGLREGDSPHKWFAYVAVRGPWLAAWDGTKVRDVFVPAPANLMRLRQDGAKDKLALLRPLHPDVDLPGWDDTDVPDTRANGDGDRPRTAGETKMRPLMTREPGEKMEGVGGYLNRLGLRRYVEGREIGEENLVPASALLDFEDRTGIGIDPETQSVRTGEIYSARHLRLRERIGPKGGGNAEGCRVVLYFEVGWEVGLPAELAGKVDLATAFEGGVPVVALGGEGRRVALRRTPQPEVWPSGGEDTDARFATLLVTPSLHTSRNGSARPPWMPPECGRLVAAAVPKPLPVSGWELGGRGGAAYGVPRPMRHAVPAGSVYFWERGGQAGPDKAMPTLFQLADAQKDRSAGWGLALRVKWDYLGGPDDKATGKGSA